MAWHSNTMDDETVDHGCTAYKRTLGAQIYCSPSGCRDQSGRGKARKRYFNAEVTVIEHQTAEDTPNGVVTDS